MQQETITLSSDPDRLNWPDLVAEGVEARQRRDGAQWELGDLAAKVETSYGAHDLERYAEEIDVNLDTLQEYRRTAKAYAEKSWRQDKLSFEHHRVIAARTDRAYWLAIAAEKRWSVAEMRRQIAEADQISDSQRDARRDWHRRLREVIAWSNTFIELSSDEQIAWYLQDMENEPPSIDAIRTLRDSADRILNVMTGGTE